MDDNGAFSIICGRELCYLLLYLAGQFQIVIRQMRIYSALNGCEQSYIVMHNLFIQSENRYKDLLKLSSLEIN